jgi:tRNA1(Val) A37 N6-methylase TrmN6
MRCSAEGLSFASRRKATESAPTPSCSPRQDVSLLVDIGAGVGAVGLAALARLPDAHGGLVEKDGDLAALAEENATRNGMRARTRVLRLDVTSAAERREAGLIDGAADLVLTNPPFFEAHKVRISGDAKRASAYVFATDAETDNSAAPLETWIIASLSLLRPGGRFIIIHRPEALAQMLAAFGRRLGAIEILPVYPSANVNAHRLIVAGHKGARGPTHLRPGLVLHDETGAFTAFAEALHRGEAAIDWTDAPRRRRPRPQPALR